MINLQLFKPRKRTDISLKQPQITISHITLGLFLFKKETMNVLLSSVSVGTLSWLSSQDILQENTNDQSTGMIQIKATFV